jgi:hypothetical protein
MTDDPRYPVGRFDQPAVFDLDSVPASLATLRELPERLATAVTGLDDDQLDTPYRPGGWTVRQVVHHLADSHLNAYQRTRLTLTEESPRIIAYDEKSWAELTDARSLAIGPSLSILEGLHVRWVALLEGLDPDEWHRTHIHPDYQRPIALWWQLALYDWHCRHHVGHVTHLRARQGW